MPSPNKIYRVYCYDAQMNVLTGDLVEAASDAEAIAMVEADGMPSKCEIWDGDRLVAQLAAERRQA